MSFSANMNGSEILYPFEKGRIIEHYLQEIFDFCLSDYGMDDNLVVVDNGCKLIPFKINEISRCKKYY